MSVASAYAQVPAELVDRYDGSGPRYTSYPTAVVFDDGVGPATYAEHLEQASASDEPLSLYLHLPFCRERCWYCACNVVISPYPEVERHYRDVLLTEVRDVARRLGGRRRIRQLHWGGGTPTYAAPAELAAFHEAVLECFELEPDAEVAVEIDPRVTTTEHLAALAEGGFNRLSVGVQDFAPEVGRAIGREQDYAPTVDLIDAARRYGFKSVNIDLIYGLPLQTPEAFAHTLARVLSIRPDRVATYGYAHLPARQPHQRRIAEASLPGGDERVALFELAASAFVCAGYAPIGMDHFALPEDELARAAGAGALGRNFMGYTVRSAPDTVACGLSAIGDVAGGYFQNTGRLVDYETTVESGRLATTRGVVLTDDDRLRRHVIAALMVNLALDIEEVETRFGVDFASAFEWELAALEPMQADGLIDIRTERLAVTPLGRRFLRSLCMPFDAHLERARRGGARFSRTV